MRYSPDAAHVEVTLSIQIEIRRPVAAATVAELVWLDDTGRPQAAPATPLLLGDQPAVAYPYALAAEARQLAAAPVAALVLSDPRMTGSDWQSLAITGRARLIEDRDGALFAAQLLRQELRKYPPARALADSIMLRRENWWYLPRLIVALEFTSATQVAARPDATAQLLAVGTGERRLHVDTVRVDESVPDRLQLASLADRPLPDGPAILFGHDFAVPDLEVWTPWTTRGRLAGGVLAVDQRPERSTLAPIPGLWERLRRHRSLERGCRRGIAVASRAAAGRA